MNPYLKSGIVLLTGLLMGAVIVPPPPEHQPIDAAALLQGQGGGKGNWADPQQGMMRRQGTDWSPLYVVPVSDFSGCQATLQKVGQLAQQIVAHESHAPSASGFDHWPSADPQHVDAMELHTDHSRELWTCVTFPTHDAVGALTFMGVYVPHPEAVGQRRIGAPENIAALDPMVYTL